MNKNRKLFQDNLRKNIYFNENVSNDDNQILSDEMLKNLKDKLKDYKALKSDWNKIGKDFPIR